MSSGYTRFDEPSISLHFIIIGGSIAGLACAYAIRCAGHHVLVVERTDGHVRSLGSIRSPPNMSRLLKNWGLENFLTTVGVQCSRFTFLQGETGESLASLDLKQELLQELLGDSFSIQHGDLHSELYRLATEAGVDFRFNTEVVKEDTGAMGVYFSNGDVVNADVIIGADGCDSHVRRVVLNEETEGILDTHLTLSLTVAVDLMRQDPDLRPLTENSDWTFWLSDDCVINGNLTHSRRRYSLTIRFPSHKEDLTRFGEHWEPLISVDSLNLDFHMLEPRIQKIIRLAKTAHVVTQLVREPLESLACDKAKIGLVGDAAHPMMPNGTHSVAMAIEDAVTLGELFSTIHHLDQIPRLLAAYEEIRQPRCALAQVHEHDNHSDFLCLPLGPLQECRDKNMRASMSPDLNWDEVDADFLQNTWGLSFHLLTHDAKERVDEWWYEWGHLLDRESDIHMHEIDEDELEALIELESHCI